MSEFDTFGITLSVNDWRALLDLAQQADRSPSDYLRMIIRREVIRILKPDAPQSIAAQPAESHGEARS